MLEQGIRRGKVDLLPLLFAVTDRVDRDASAFEEIGEYCLEMGVDPETVLADTLVVLNTISPETAEKVRQASPEHAASLVVDAYLDQNGPIVSDGLPTSGQVQTAVAKACDLFPAFKNKEIYKDAFNLEGRTAGFVILKLLHGKGAKFPDTINCIKTKESRELEKKSKPFEMSSDKSFMEYSLRANKRYPTQLAVAKGLLSDFSKDFKRYASVTYKERPYREGDGLFEKIKQEFLDSVENLDLQKEIEHLPKVLQKAFLEDEDYYIEDDSDEIKPYLKSIFSKAKLTESEKSGLTPEQIELREKALKTRFILMMMRCNQSGYGNIPTERVIQFTGPLMDKKVNEQELVMGGEQENLGKNYRYEVSENFQAATSENYRRIMSMKDSSTLAGYTAKVEMPLLDQEGKGEVSYVSGLKFSPAAFLDKETYKNVTDALGSSLDAVSKP